MSLSDQTFTVFADFLVESGPTTPIEKKAFQTYQNGFRSQIDGQYANAFKSYTESLQLETDPIARSFTLYNIGLMYYRLNQVSRAFLNLNQSVRLNPSNASAFNMLRVLYHRLGESLLGARAFNQSEIFFTRAKLYWSEATRIAPFQYLEAQNWLQMQSQLNDN